MCFVYVGMCAPEIWASGKPSRPTLPSVWVLISGCQAGRQVTFSLYHLMDLGFLFSWDCWDSFILCNPGWPQSWFRPVSGSQVCTITPDKCFASPVSKCWVRTYFHSQDKKLVSNLFTRNSPNNQFARWQSTMTTWIVLYMQHAEAVTTFRSRWALYPPLRRCQVFSKWISPIWLTPDWPRSQLSRI